MAIFKRTIDYYIHDDSEQEPTQTNKDTVDAVTQDEVFTDTIAGFGVGTYPGLITLDGDTLFKSIAVAETTAMGVISTRKVGPITDVLPWRLDIVYLVGQVDNRIPFPGTSVVFPTGTLDDAFDSVYSGMESGMFPGFPGAPIPPELSLPIITYDSIEGCRVETWVPHPFRLENAPVRIVLEENSSERFEDALNTLTVLQYSIAHVEIAQDGQRFFAVMTR